MVNFHILTRKILKGIRVKYGQTILYSEEQKVSEEKGKLYTEYKVKLLVTTEKYNEMHPGQELSPKLHKSKWATIPLKRAIRIEELFMYLYEEIWKKLESGEMYEQGERARERIRSRYAVGRGKGRGGRKGVLQDSQVGEELPGGISGGEREYGEGEMPCDIGEAGEH